jgi:hypothetical protein
MLTASDFGIADSKVHPYLYTSFQGNTTSNVSQCRRQHILMPSFQQPYLHHRTWIRLLKDGINMCCHRDWDTLDVVFSHVQVATLYLPRTGRSVIFTHAPWNG